MRAYGSRPPGTAPVWHAQADSAAWRLVFTERPTLGRPGATRRAPPGHRRAVSARHTHLSASNRAEQRGHVAHWRKREPRSHVGQSVALIVHSGWPSRSCPTPTSKPRSKTRPCPRDGRRDRQGQRGEPHRRTAQFCDGLRTACAHRAHIHRGDPNHRARRPGQTQTSPASRDPVAPPGGSVKARSGVQPDCWDGVGKGHCRPRTGLPQPSSPGGSIGVPRSRNCGSLVAGDHVPGDRHAAPCAGAGASGHCHVPCPRNAVSSPRAGDARGDPGAGLLVSAASLTASRARIALIFDHNACSRYMSAATAGTATSTVVTAASTAVRARRVHRASRVRASSTPAERGASSGARCCETRAAPTRCSQRAVIRTASGRARIRYHGSCQLCRRQ